jgi:hypothetical protein
MLARSTFALFTAMLLLLLAAGRIDAATITYNTGSLGSGADGTNADTVTFVPGVVTTGGDQAASYDGFPGTNTIVPFQAGLNPASASPFTIEFWANPTNSDNDDAPLANRVAAGDRSGWAFFQRAESTGWNLRMYDGVGSNLGWDLTGGTSPLNAWTHVVARWDGSAAQLFVNGVLADSSNDGGASGTYNANTASTSANFIVASSDTGSPYTGAIDEVAFYGSALSPAQILNHFNMVSSGTPGLYHSTIRADGARLQLTNNAIPEPGSLGYLGLGALALLRRRARESRARLSTF